MATVTLSNGTRFPAGGQSILEAARAHGVILEHSCRTGRCGVCKASVTSGRTRVLRDEVSLSLAEAEAGAILTCCRAAEDDVVLDIEDLGRLAGIATRTTPCRIAALERPTPDIARVTLRLPPAGPLAFLPGQYVDVIARGVRRSYSLASAPRADGLLELLIRRYPDGVLSDYWFGEARENDLLRLEGPLGSFFLRDDGPTTILFLATGTGIAPVKALLEELAADPARAARHRLICYWGNRDPDSFVWSPGPDLPVVVHRLLSRGVPEAGMRAGYVQDAVLADGFAPDDTVVYACGSSAMIAAARAALEAAGLPPRRFFADAFYSSS